MKTTFAWYIRPSKEDFKEIWDKAILTVDANVLLDLYRYNDATRESLIRALEGFRGRIWLARQAADEFVRNRHSAIVSVAKSFNDARGEMTKLTTALDTAASHLNGNRIVPREMVSSLFDSVSGAIENAETQIQSAEKSHPDFLESDPILDRVLALFDGAIGQGFTDKDYQSALEEAQKRIEHKIPPGYLDDNKDGERRFGDYFLWRQILDYTKEKSLPTILVTSERKEDWWEVISGQTVGARPELMKEALEYAGQRVLIYKTERFLSYVAESTGSQVDEKVVEDIRAVSEIRALPNQTVKLLEQNSAESNSTINAGTLTVELHRPVFKFTCSGSLSPEMDSPPNVWIRLSEFPEGMPRFKLGAGTGTTFDFNAHVKSEDFGVLLPVGVYVIEYKATSAFQSPSTSDL